MGITAENIAEKYGITREEQDEFGLLHGRKPLRLLIQVFLQRKSFPLKSLPERDNYFQG